MGGIVIKHPLPLPGILTYSKRLEHTAQAKEDKCSVVMFPYGVTKEMLTCPE